MKVLPRPARALAAATAAITAIAGAALTVRTADATTTPATIEVTLASGETSDPQPVRVNVPRIIPKADVVFAFDLTGSMGGELQSAKDNAANIMDELDTKIADARYGVISHADYVGAYNSYGYSSTYGFASDFPYRRNLAPTSNRSLVSAAISGLTLADGADGPESFTRLLHETYADELLAWRAGARRIVIHIGDNLPHDDNLCAGVPSVCSALSTGGDPGRDNTMFTADDLDLQTVLSQMASNGVVLFELHSGQGFGGGTPGTSFNAAQMLALWDNWAGRTGGDALALTSAGDVPELIAAAVESSAATVQNLSLVPGGSYASWAAVTPGSFTNVSTPGEEDFSVTFTPPVGTPDGDYTIPLEAIGDGASFGITTATVHVVNNVGPQITGFTGPAGPVAVNSAAVLTTSFADPDATDTHTATFSWGDGTTSTPAVTAGARSVDGTHAYTTPGVYEVTVTISDEAGESDTQVFQYIVVYDPSGGFVTGGGWINSPAGAYAAEPTSSGRANFGFVSKYKKGQTTPTGETEFQLKGDGFAFHSDAYEWLVLSGAKARYKGTGAVNGVSGYGFMLTAVDGQATGGGGVDRFRMKIWDAAGNTVYDNQPGAGDDAAPTTALGGGAVVIHK